MENEIKYSIFKPGGNDTALVYGTNFTNKEKKIINDKIMTKHTNVEQVGFVDFKNNIPILLMAGGEFCGNATRSAVYAFLNGKKGKTQITVNNNTLLNAGVYNNGDVWTEIPLGKGKIDVLKNGIYKVKMEGMTSVVLKEEISKDYLKDRKSLKKHGMNIIKEFNLENNEAVGIMFCENNKGTIKINPIVWVKEIDTLFYETACGSGTTAVVMVEAYKHKESKKMKIIQPSGMEIHAEITYQKDRITRAAISGQVDSDNKVYLIDEMT
ncbi:MAG: hypothetical protein IKG56_05715 [Clostridia bacterium]|nr:hypothetical protein [Clostridia bacterium]